MVQDKGIRLNSQILSRRILFFKEISQLRQWHRRFWNCLYSSQPVFIFLSASNSYIELVKLNLKSKKSLKKHIAHTFTVYQWSYTGPSFSQFFCYHWYCLSKTKLNLEMNSKFKWNLMVNIHWVICHSQNNLSRSFTTFLGLYTVL